MSLVDQFLTFISDHLTTILVAFLVIKMVYKVVAKKEPVKEPECSKVTHITSVDQWNEVLKSNKTVVAKFSAVWCPPCNACVVPFCQWSADEDVHDVFFAHIDVDEAKEVAALNKIESMPTFKVFVSGKETGAVNGWKKSKIAELISK
eukprot:GEMP01027266.1.p1 GENE.GEMP01027266.1~~GEMP01027266.1.p1  ORF type:complete len:156 (+),score=32.48 GEMP01027266.1:26-469(+)